MRNYVSDINNCNLQLEYYRMAVRASSEHWDRRPRFSCTIARRMRHSVGKLVCGCKNVAIVSKNVHEKFSVTIVAERVHRAKEY